MLRDTLLHTHNFLHAPSFTYLPSSAANLGQPNLVEGISAANRTCNLQRPGLVSSSVRSESIAVNKLQIIIIVWTMLASKDDWCGDTMSLFFSSPRQHNKPDKRSKFLGASPMLIPITNEEFPAGISRVTKYPRYNTRHNSNLVNYAELMVSKHYTHAASCFLITFSLHSRWPIAAIQQPNYVLQV